jgi:hypothetical protein
LPILVRQASSKKPIFYEDLANEIGMPNPRNLNWVLGSVGVTLQELSQKPGWGAELPHIQSLVINQTDKLPGSGFDEFLADRVAAYRGLSKAQKREYLEGYWHNIFAYSRWDEVLATLGLKPETAAAEQVVERAKNGQGHGGGEGEEHRTLKEYVRTHPNVIGLPAKFPQGVSEAPLPSGDRLDVLFSAQKRMIAVEVKSKISNEVDLTRGLFQCVKYKAVMEAERGYVRKNYSVEAILVVGRDFPERLRPLQNSLGVQVVEWIA